jgi:hypothetical protein
MHPKADICTSSVHFLFLEDEGVNEISSRSHLIGRNSLSNLVPMLGKC